ncbi:MAG: tetratricopeptide repeat protein [Candidatus Glassbacteria bacterium]|nr:tetratricopeptide repeat protein [Candidatus Glassbacteria bacterium]
MNDRQLKENGPELELSRRVHALRLGWLGTLGLYGLFFALVQLVFYLYAGLLGGPGVYYRGESGLAVAAWAWWVSFLVPVLVCLVFLRGQDARNRGLLTRTWDSWRWFDHGVLMFDTDLEFTGNQEESFARAANLDPDDPYALNNLGSVYLQQGRVEEAAAAYRKAVRLNPGYHKAYANLGVAYARLGEIKRAVGFYRKALKLEPKDPATHLNLGAALAGQGKNTQAAAHLREFLRLAPDHPRKEEISGLLRRLV